jgi:hypothetical protein
MDMVRIQMQWMIFFFGVHNEMLYACKSEPIQDVWLVPAWSFRGFSLNVLSHLFCTSIFGVSSLWMQVHLICCMSDRCPMDWYCNSNFYGNAAIKHSWFSGVCTKVEPSRKKCFILVPQSCRPRKSEAEEYLWSVANICEALVFAVIQMTGSALDQFLPGWVSFQPSDQFEYFLV